MKNEKKNVLKLSQRTEQMWKACVFMLVNKSIFINAHHMWRCCKPIINGKSSLKINASWVLGYNPFSRGETDDDCFLRLFYFSYLESMFVQIFTNIWRLNTNFISAYFLICTFTTNIINYCETSPPFLFIYLYFLYFR